MTTAAQVWVVMDLFYSMTCFGLNSWEWYLFGGLSVALLRQAVQLEAQKSVQDADRGPGMINTRLMGYQ